MGAASLSLSYDTLAQRSQVQAQHNEVLSTIDRESAERQALFERYAQEGTGVTLRSYQCDPGNPPDFDAVPWARNENFPVYDGVGTLSGFVRPDGTYQHLGYCSP